MSRVVGGTVVEIGQGRELIGTATNDGDGQIEAQSAGAGEGFRRAAHSNPDGERVLDGTGINALSG